VQANGDHAVRSRFELVIVVASLGGLPVLSALVDGLPATFPVPVLVMQHALRSADPHRLTWLLGLRTTLSARTAQSGLPAFMPGVTVVPGGVAATIDPAGRLNLSESGAASGDALMTTAAAAATRGAVIGMVLSGMLRDGSEGVRAVKRHGGRIIAQDPVTAKAPGMPSSAIATGCVDFVLPPHRLATALIALTMAPGAADLLTVALPHWAKMGA
jgi:two-component system chemotaxis response regulator CheB